jgi:hypothetical protein
MAADTTVPVVGQQVERVELMAVERDKADRPVGVRHLSREYLACKIPPTLKRLSPREGPTWPEDAVVGGCG